MSRDIEFIGRRFRTRRGDELKLRNIHWIWEGFLPRGQVTLWYGQGDAGKSTGLADLMARVTRGADFPCGEPNQLGAPAKVLIINDEDSAEENIGPKMKAAGADPTQYRIVDDIMHTSITDLGATKTEAEVVNDLYEQVKAIENQLRFEPETAVVLIDPITAFLGKRNANNNAEVKALITALQRVAEKTGLCIVMVTHKNKNLEAAAAEQVIGSVAWWHGPRMIFSVSGTNEAGQDPVAVVQCEKANICRKPLPRRFSVIQTTVESGNPEEPNPIKTALVKWDDQPYEGEVPGSEEQAGGRGGHLRKKRVKVMDWVWSQCQLVPIDSDSLKTQADLEGYQWQRVTRAIRELIGQGKIVKQNLDERGQYVLHNAAMANSN